MKNDDKKGISLFFAHKCKSLPEPYTALKGQIGIAKIFIIIPNQVQHVLL